MLIVSRKEWLCSKAGIADYKERTVVCRNQEALLSALRGFRLRPGQAPTDPALILGLFDLSQPQWPVVLINSDGRSESVSIQTLH